MMRPRHEPGTGPMQLLTVRHVTTYRYKQPVAFGEHRMMLRPRDSYDQRLIEARLDITPEPADLRWVHDVFGNCVAHRAVLGPRDGTALRQHDPPRSFADQCPRFPDRGLRRTYPFSYGSEESPTCCARSSGNISIPSREVDRWARQFLRRHGPTGTRELLAAMTQCDQGSASPMSRARRWARRTRSRR